MIFGARIEQAREFRGLTQGELAESVGTKRVNIAFIENGRVQPATDLGAAIATALNFPSKFFEREPSLHFAMGTLEFRSRAALSAKRKKHAHQYAHLVFELATFLASKLQLPTLRLPRLPGNPEEAATVLRSELGISPNAPISNLSDILERAGVFVFALPELFPGAFEGCAGFSVWGGNGPRLVPSIFVAASLPGDRERLTIAHEVGELMLLDMPPGRDREKIANRFAGALLMPAEAVFRDLEPPFALHDFIALKKRYGVSIQAGLVRAHQLGIVDDRRYHALYQQLSSRGWRKQEPSEFEIAREKPRGLLKMAELLYGEQVDVVRLADDAGLDPWLVRQLLATHASKADLRKTTTAPKNGAVLPLRSAALRPALPMTITQERPEN